MKRIFITIAILTLLSLILSACTAAAPTAPAAARAITLTDGLKRTVTLEKPAQKIVSLAPSNTELLFALGAGGQVIGRDEFSDYPSEAKTLPSVGGSMGSYNLEAITKLQPDLVLLAAINTPEQVKALEDLGIKAFYLANPEQVEGIYANLQIVGQLTGREAEAKSLVDTLKQRVEKVKTTLAKVSSRPKVFYELDGSDPAKPWTSGPGTYMDQLLAMAGGTNASAGLSEQWGQISQEELLVQNPDVILLGDGAYGVTADQVAARPGWNVLKAVQDGRILTFDDNLVSRPGPRLVDGLEMLAKLLHPESFP